MPIYSYQCVDCAGQDQRVAALDDHTARCAACGGLMLRLDEDAFLPFFEEQARLAAALGDFDHGQDLARQELSAVPRPTFTAEIVK